MFVGRYHPEKKTNEVVSLLNVIAKMRGKILSHLDDGGLLVVSMTICDGSGPLLGLFVQ